MSPLESGVGLPRSDVAMRVEVLKPATPAMLGDPMSVFFSGVGNDGRVTDTFETLALGGEKPRSARFVSAARWDRPTQVAQECEASPAGSDRSARRSTPPPRRPSAF